MTFARTALAPVGPKILSSYAQVGGTGGPRTALIPLRELGVAGTATPDTVKGLRRLQRQVTRAGGDLRVTDLFRPSSVQLKARNKYEHWVASGKPAVGSPGWDEATMKNAYVARPGRSFHNAGRAIDLHLEMIGFPDTKADQQLDTLWQICKRIGWRPIIDTPDEKAKEAWHLDFMGEWAPVYDRLSYSEAALCAVLDIGTWESIERPGWRFVQAQLQRAGYDCGVVDGWPGSTQSKTRRALEAAGLDHGAKAADALFEASAALQSSSTLLWKP